MICTRCERHLVEHDTWYAKSVAERKRLSPTHAVGEGATGLCGSCYRRGLREKADREAVYTGGWIRRGGVLYPRVNHWRIPDRTKENAQ